MADVVNFFRKPTTILGNDPVASEWYEMTQFKSLFAQTLLMGVIGTPTAVNTTLQGSSDMDALDALVGPTPLTQGVLENMSVDAPPRYVRMVVQATGGTNPGYTLWSKGVVRES